MSKETPVPEDFLCPITLEIMKDPVIASDEQTYEHTAVLLWMQQQDTSPVTREPLKPDFRRNRALQHVIRSWVEQHGGDCKDDDAAALSSVSNGSPSYPDSGISPVRSIHRGIEHLPALVISLQDLSNPHGREYAANALCNLAQDARSRRAVADAALPALACLLQDTTNPRGQAHAAGCLFQLAADTILQICVARAALSAVAQLLQAPASPECTAAAAGTLARLASNIVVQQQFAASGLPALVAFLSTSSSYNAFSVRARISAAVAIQFLAACPRHRPAIIRTALPALVGLVGGAEESARSIAACTLGVLADTPQLQQAVADAALPALVRLLQDRTDAEGQTVAAATLGCLAGTSAMRRQVLMAAGLALDDAAQDASSAECSIAAKRALQKLHASRKGLSSLQLGYKCRHLAQRIFVKFDGWLDEALDLERNSKC